MAWLNRIVTPILGDIRKNISVVVFGCLVAAVGPAFTLFYSDVLRALTWRTSVAGFLMVLVAIGVVGLYITENRIGKSNHVLREKLLDLARRARDAGRKNTGTRFIQGEAAAVIAAGFGQDQAKTFEAQKFWEVDPPGEGIANYLEVLASKTAAKQN